MRIVSPLFACLFIACASGEVPPTGDGDGDGDVDASPGLDTIGEICANDPCDVYDQCGCDAPQVCDLDFATLDGTTACRDVTSPGMDTASCGNFDTTECAGGYICLGSGGSQCRQYCEADADCNDGFCLLEPATQDGPIPGVKACTKNCDPVSTNPSGCPTGFGCGVFDNNGTGFADCVPANAAGTDEVSCADGAAGDPCAPGFLCIIFSVNGVEDRRVCKQRCEFPGGTCGVGSCQELDPAPTLGTTAYGFCNN